MDHTYHTNLEYHFSADLQGASFMIIRGGFRFDDLNAWDECVPFVEICGIDCCVVYRVY